MVFIVLTGHVIFHTELLQKTHSSSTTDATPLSSIELFLIFNVYSDTVKDKPSQMSCDDDDDIALPKSTLLLFNSAGMHSSPETSMRKGRWLELSCSATRRSHTWAGILTVS